MRSSFFSFFNSNGAGENLFFEGEEDKLELAITDDNALPRLDEFIARHAGSFIFLALSYELYSETESSLALPKGDYDFPKLLAMVPKRVGDVDLKSYKISSRWGEKFDGDELLSTSIPAFPTQKKLELKKRFSRTSYLEKAQKLLEAIQRGDLYELNFCQEFFADQVDIDPWETYQQLNTKTQAPYSACVKLGDKWILSASPELYLQKSGPQLISSPIKGTIPRANKALEDLENSRILQSSIKEQSENVMIVDLVRNDLSKVAKKGTVHVPELFAVKSFKTVHHLVSTVQAELRNEVSFVEILRASFPMGSMTGAPKISAIKHAQLAEEFPRGIYSGSLGYIKPNGDFSLNVVIRSIIFDQNRKKLSFKTGSALTARCNPELEYEECLVKANALISSLNGKLV
ncbi:MAG: anthranilate synthase component I family protein [Luteibaculum sp.]